MPRLPDPELEARIVAAALRLLDRGGEAVITMRSVAREAGTTTPTIYGRFSDRDRLMETLVDHITNDIMAMLRRKTDVEAMFREYLRYSQAHPLRMNLSVTTFGRRFVAGEEMPAFELLMARISEQLGVRGRECQDLALAVASLAFGTAQGMIAAGSDTRHAGQLRRSSLRALRMLVAAFSPAQAARQASARRPANH
ncbi:MAG TPA: TetR/AcrR family transcriptional regulator [Candidatus Eisenbacteria bacterium]|nr:TetR/AcrR family transcriptional regulator [Candidatus Eisenbacteria bacterium]